MNMEIATRFKCTSSIGYFTLHIKSKFLILLAIGQVNLGNIGSWFVKSLLKWSNKFCHDFNGNMDLFIKTTDTNLPTINPAGKYIGIMKITSHIQTQTFWNLMYT